MTTSTSAAGTTTTIHPSSARIAELVTPRSIAVVGASSTSMWTHFTLQNLTAGGFAGDVHLVNRRGVPVLGRETVTTIDEVPGSPDLAILLTGSHTTEQLLAECRAKGIRNAILLSGGFSEAGEEGVALQRRVVEEARAADQLILGPNNLGFLNLPAKTVAFAHMTELPPLPGPVGVASQSGALAIYLIPYMASRGVGTSVCFTVGNEAMLSAVDAMNFLVDDPSTKVIAAYLEQIADPAQFIEVARRASEVGKPIVVFKSGRSQAAARVASAHTGSLVGDDRIADAVLRQLGVVRVDSIEQLVSTAGMLAEYGALPGPRVAFVTASGAMCSVIAERADGLGIELPEPDAETARLLHEDGVPPEAAIHNPLDVTGLSANNPTMLANANSRFAEDDNFDVVVITASLPVDESSEQLMSASLAPTLASIAASSKPMIPMNFLTTPMTPYARDFAKRVGYPHVADSCDRGVPAIAHGVWWGRRMREIEADGQEPSVEPIAVPADVESFTEVELSAWLSDHGVPVVPTRLTTDADEAVAAADEIGYPVVMKIASKDIAHKTDVGGVRLGLRTAEEVRAADADIRSSVAALAPEAEIRGIAVAPMRSGGQELLVGVVRDEQWGQILAIGFGGVLVEVLDDTALRRLPASKDEILRAVRSLKGARLLEGFRGSRAADLDAVADAIHAITRVAIGLGDRLDTLEVNPLLVDGDQVEAADALVVWRSEEEA